MVLVFLILVTPVFANFDSCVCMFSIIFFIPAICALMVALCLVILVLAW